MRRRIILFCIIAIPIVVFFKERLQEKPYAQSIQPSTSAVRSKGAKKKPAAKSAISSTPSKEAKKKPTVKLVAPDSGSGFSFTHKSINISSLFRNEIPFYYNSDFLTTAQLRYGFQSSDLSLLSLSSAAQALLAQNDAEMAGMFHGDLRGSGPGLSLVSIPRAAHALLPKIDEDMTGIFHGDLRGRGFGVGNNPILTPLATQLKPIAVGPPVVEDAKEERVSEAVKLHLETDFPSAVWIGTGMGIWPLQSVSPGTSDDLGQRKEISDARLAEGTLNVEVLAAPEDGELWLQPSAKEGGTAIPVKPAKRAPPIAEPEPEQPRRVNRYAIPKRIDAGHIEGKGIGYELGYTKLSVVLGPEYRVGYFLPLLDLRGVVFDDGKLAGNVGFIGRYLPKSLCEVFGFNVFYDVRQGKLGTFNQVGGGFEVLNKRWEVHGNAYVPVGVIKHKRACVFDDFAGDFRAVRRRYEFASYAFDANAGYYVVNSKNFQLYASAGPYYFFGKFHTSAVGGKAMVRPQYKDYLAVELSVSHDRIFETIYQVNVIVSIPLYSYSPALKNKKGTCGVPNRQIYQPIDRDIILRRKCCWHANFD